MLRYSFFLATLFLLFNSCSNKHQILYHNIYLGFSDERPVVIDVWNNKDNGKLIRETVDKKNRVLKIEFLRDGKPAQFGYFPISTVVYKYSKTKIVETAFDKENKPINADMHNAHYQSIYHLDTEGFIKKIERFSDFEIRDSFYFKNNLPPPTKEILEESIKEHFFIHPSDEPLEVEFYKYSFAKLNGVYPVSDNYVVRKDYDKKHKDTWIEKGIEDGVNKLHESKNKHQ